MHIVYIQYLYSTATLLHYNTGAAKSIAHSQARLGRRELSRGERRLSRYHGALANK